LNIFILNKLLYLNNNNKVLALLPLEMAFGYLEHFSSLLVRPFNVTSSGDSKEPEMLNAITKPLTNAIIQVDKDVLERMVLNLTSEDESLIKRKCTKTIYTYANESSGLNSTELIEITESYPCN
jgi:hypothetical protein